MRILTVICFVFLTYSLPAVAFNPGFDCGQATGATQKVICSDYQLSRASRLLIEANNTVINRNGPDTNYFSHTQQQWFDALAKSCAVAPMGAAAKACLQDAYESRMDQLRSINGCSKVTAQAGEKVTIHENSYALVPEGTHILAVAGNNKMLLSGDFNTINIRNGEVIVTIPADAQEPFNNLVDTCGVKKRP